MTATALLQEHEFLKLPEAKIPRIGFERILFATDFSDGSPRVLDYAAGVARYYGAELCLLHAIPPVPLGPIPMVPLSGDLEQDQIEARAKMRALAHTNNLDGIHHQFLITTGDAASVIAAEVERSRPDLLVLGTHGRGAFKHFVIGSVAEEVLRQVSCPVLTIGLKAGWPQSNIAQFRSILFATDFGPACESAAKYAVSLAEEHGARLTFLHAMPPLLGVETGYGMGAYSAQDLAVHHEQARNNKLEKLRALLPANAKLEKSPEFVVETSFPLEGIMDVAAIRDVNLIVIGTRHARHAELASHMPWSVLHEVLSAAKCPVLTVSN
jgi:nucleotide-binding universal stress UspA family protein